MEVSELKAQFWIRIRIGMRSGSGPALNPLLFRIEGSRSMKAKMAPKREKVASFEENPDNSTSKRKEIDLTASWLGVGVGAG